MLSCTVESKKNTAVLPRSFVARRPVVFIGPFEHHSNILPWRENNVDVVAIAEDARGGLDLNDLEVKLKKYSSRKLKIG